MRGRGGGGCRGGVGVVGSKEDELEGGVRKEGSKVGCEEEMGKKTEL